MCCSCSVLSFCLPHRVGFTLTYSFSTTFFIPSATIFARHHHRAAAELHTAPATPIHDPLCFDFGGYGGVHYSPDGHIITHSAATGQMLKKAEQDTHTLDLTVPVFIFAWDDERYKPIRILTRPHVNDAESAEFRLGQVVLQDYQAAFVAAGFSVQSHIQCYPEPSGIWITVPWSTDAVGMFGLNKVIYLRNPGVNVTLLITFSSFTRIVFLAETALLAY
ncbi:hypothetical protein B0H10DRAFT_2224194 [Mycena sp. CBHHK59/15]|nr:hypothetical protein B0H10DRAFT_2224194 [Mycena sp. CBHHK59/15]